MKVVDKTFYQGGESHCCMLWSRSWIQRYLCCCEKKVGFQFYSLEDCSAALKNTLYTVEIREEDKTIGIARIVGDGRIVFFIKDVVVDPRFQRKRDRQNAY